MRSLPLQSIYNATRMVHLAILVATIHHATSATEILAAQPGVASVNGTRKLSSGATWKSVPFSGSFRAVESHDFQFPTLYVDAVGGGVATHLGRFSLTYESEVDLTILAGSGSAHFVAVNGDDLYAEVTGQAYPTQNPNVVSIVEAYTIIGGTGRFESAIGSVTVMRRLNTLTGVTAGSFQGTILKH
jgi:hypothetical protein